MANNPDYSPYHPRWYRTPVPIFWWISKWSSVRFILRELSAVFVAFYVIVLLFHMRALSQGPEAFASFQEWARSGPVVVLHFLALVMVLFHSITWFNLAPVAMVMKLGGKRVPGLVIQLVNYSAWVVISLVLAWILLRP